jgi:hypothetical protein
LRGASARGIAGASRGRVGIEGERPLAERAAPDRLDAPAALAQQPLAVSPR